MVDLTLDDAVLYCRKMMSKYQIVEDSEQEKLYFQIAEWLQDYKEIKENEIQRQYLSLQRPKGIWNLYSYGVNVGYYQCSNCDNFSTEKSNFCKWCGANMT